MRNEPDTFPEIPVVAAAALEAVRDAERISERALLRAKRVSSGCIRAAKKQ
jgi:hypothetical protein